MSSSTHSTLKFIKFYKSGRLTNLLHNLQMNLSSEANGWYSSVGISKIEEICL